MNLTRKLGSKNLVELSKKVFQYIDIQDGWEKCVQSALGEKINYYILKKIFLMMIFIK